LCKIFQNLTGSTPIEYLLRIRIEQAKMLLRRSDMKVIDIAYDCGYSSSQYFANSFKHATGFTPSEFRENGLSLSNVESMDWENIKFRSEEEELLRVRDFTKSK
jgi:AraC-like DNA-binding protein